MLPAASFEVVFHARLQACEWSALRQRCDGSPNVPRRDAPCSWRLNASSTRISLWLRTRNTVATPVITSPGHLARRCGSRCNIGIPCLDDKGFLWFELCL